MSATKLLDGLNPQQREAVLHDIDGRGANVGRPLLIIAGAGTGKTNTLSHRVAHLIANGADPARIMMLTFTVQAAQEMQSRVAGILSADQSKRSQPRSGRITWAGTFHAIGQRLLRTHGRRVGLTPSFTLADSSDAADLLDMLMSDLGLSSRGGEFPSKETCLAIYSRKVNSKLKLKATLKRHYPWCAHLEDKLAGLFRAYVEAKQAQNVLDFDDFLLFWDVMLKDKSVRSLIGGRFDHIMVDEYQDTNALQNSILNRLKPDGAGLTVVGDDAQAIYGFRAADVRNILDFPTQFTPPAAVIKLELNYRSTAPILAASNAVIDLAIEGFAKRLIAVRKGGQKPRFVTVDDDQDQARFVAREVLDRLSEGRKLKEMAVLFRSSRHSAALDIELTRHNIPTRIFGGSKFTEAAHIKDMLGVLKWAENPADRVTGLRILKLLPGVGVATASKLLDTIAGSADPVKALATFEPPPRAQEAWPGFAKLMRRLNRDKIEWPAEFDAALAWYRPILEDRVDDNRDRIADLEQLRAIASGFKTRKKFIADLTLDPPSKRRKGGAAPIDQDSDYLTLSTIHSCKGREWRTVFVLSVIDGCIPSSKSKTQVEIEEERRLLYVAMTRAKRELTLVAPWRVLAPGQMPDELGDATVQRSRFIPDGVLDKFEHTGWRADGGQSGDGAAGGGEKLIDVNSRVRSLWPA